MEPSLIGLMLSLPSHTTTPRTKAWRALKALGAAVLRDGVYVLPAGVGHEEKLLAIAHEITRSDGTAELINLSPRDAEQGARFAALFDRSEDFSPLVGRLRELLGDATLDAPAIDRHLRVLRRQVEQVAAIDFFPGEAQAQARRALEDCEARLAALVSPDEPHPVERQIARLDRADYQQRIWATRARPWVDRLASAWLIRFRIDPAARFIWLDRTTDCPPDALGFDFDGGTFTHIGGLVTFETLMASFGLVEPGLMKLAEVVHFLDVGGVTVPEAQGLAAVLDGLRRVEQNDDRLLKMAFPIFDALLVHFTPDPE